MEGGSECRWNSYDVSRSESEAELWRYVLMKCHCIRGAVLSWKSWKDSTVLRVFGNAF
jgi:hypothetical protein